MSTPLVLPVTLTAIEAPPDAIHSVDAQLAYLPAVESFAVAYKQLDLGDQPADWVIGEGGRPLENPTLKRLMSQLAQRGLVLDPDDADRAAAFNLAVRDQFGNHEIAGVVGGNGRHYLYLLGPSARGAAQLQPMIADSAYDHTWGTATIATDTDRRRLHDTAATIATVSAGQATPAAGDLQARTEMLTDWLSGQPATFSVSTDSVATALDATTTPGVAATLSTNLGQERLRSLSDAITKQPELGQDLHL